MQHRKSKKDMHDMIMTIIVLERKILKKNIEQALFSR